MSAKKIAINASMLDERPTGVGVYTYNIANALFELLNAEGGRQLTVFTPADGCLNKNMKLVRIPGIVQSSRYGKLAAIARFFWNSFVYPFKGKHYDLLINTTSHGSFTLKNQVITIHDLLSLQYNNISWHQRIYFRYLLPLLVSKSRLVITVSNATKQEVMRHLNCPAEKIQVVYNGYNRNVYTPEPEPARRILQTYQVNNYILAVGPTYPHKNFELLVRAYAGLDEQTRNNYPLVIAGGMKPYVNKIKLLVDELSLQQQVHFLGYVPVDLMPALYKEARLLVFPSLYEGFGFPLLEAMACGCPVLSSNTSSMPEVCGDAALYFNPMDEQALCANLDLLCKNEELRLKLRVKGLERARLFSWEQAAQQLKEITAKYC